MPQCAARTSCRHHADIPAVIRAQIDSADPAEIETTPGDYELTRDFAAHRQLQRRIFHGTLVQQSHLSAKVAKLACDGC